MRTGTHKRTLHVDERGRVGHGEGLVGGRQGLALMAAGHHHLHGQPLEVVLRMLLLLQRRAELRGGVLRPLPLERQHAMELLHRTPARETPHAVANRSGHGPSTIQIVLGPWPIAQFRAGGGSGPGPRTLAGGRTTGEAAATARRDRSPTIPSLLEGSGWRR